MTRALSALATVARWAGWIVGILLFAACLLIALVLAAVTFPFWGTSAGCNR